MTLRKAPGSGLPVIKRVAKTIERHAMFAPHDKVLAGVSGGPDSVALLWILHALSGAWHLELGVAHLDHGLRPEAAQQEAALVSRLAADLGLACHTQSIEIDEATGSLEERAREARYDFFNQLAKARGYTKIALGHHTDDNAEAVLQRLLRGSGIRGMGGIPPVRDNRIVRPLIDLRRDEILDYLHRRKIPYLHDVSNNDPRFERNRIRHHLLPLLARHYNPNIVATLHRTADLCREEDQWLQAEFDGQAKALVARQTSLRLDLHISRLQSAPLALQRRLIREALGRWQGTLYRVGASHIDAVISLLSPDRESGRISLPHQLRAERRPRHLRFSRERRLDPRVMPAPGIFQYSIATKECLPAKLEIASAHGCLHLFQTAANTLGPIDADPHSAHFDLDQLSFPLVVRNFQPGDRLRPFGMRGSQKLKQLFGDRKIPRYQRAHIPLLISQDRIAWVAGVRRGRLAAIGPATSQVLVARWHSAGRDDGDLQRAGAREPGSIAAEESGNAPLA